MPLLAPRTPFTLAFACSRRFTASTFPPASRAMCSGVLPDRGDSTLLTSAMARRARRASELLLARRALRSCRFSVGRLDGWPGDSDGPGDGRLPLEVGRDESPLTATWVGLTGLWRPGWKWPGPAAFAPAAELVDNSATFRLPPPEASPGTATVVESSGVALTAAEGRETGADVAPMDPRWISTTCCSSCGKATVRANLKERTCCCEPWSKQTSMLCALMSNIAASSPWPMTSAIFVVPFQEGFDLHPPEGAGRGAPRRSELA
mmetsp:Transcript_6032/g.16203  ORF Transcript_6032/g.16203 Transcript_6032/m.16203 type:complete len:263 (+) Transcript_6032:663-1451(+)